MWCLSKIFKLFKGPLLCLFSGSCFLFECTPEIVYTHNVKETHYFSHSVHCCSSSISNPYHAQAGWTPKVQSVCLVCPYFAQTWYTFLVLVWFEEVCFGVVWLLMHKHKNGCATWTWSKIMYIIINIMHNEESRNVRGHLWPKQHKISHKKVSKVMFSVLFSNGLRPRYDVMMYVQEVTENVSPGQQGTGEEG